MCHDVHAGRVEPDEEWLLVGPRFVDELEREIEDLVIDRLHPFWVERARVLYSLLSDLTPPRLFGRIFSVAGPRVDHVPWADHVLDFLRIGPMGRTLHCVQVVKVAEKLVEAVNGR